MAIFKAAQEAHHYSDMMDYELIYQCCVVLI